LRESPIVLADGSIVEVEIKTQGDGKVKKMVSGVNYG
jgi:hypothetical protein